MFRNPTIFNSVGSNTHSLMCCIVRRILVDINCLFAVQVGCDTFTQLFTQHPEVLDYLADYDTMVLEGINIGEALR
jgi:hypothetical protein